jgi:hypothetical protein
MTTQNIADSEIPPAKARRAPSSDNNFFAAFASLRLCSGHALREIFRIFGCGSAALCSLWLIEFSKIKMIAR